MFAEAEFAAAAAAAVGRRGWLMLSNTRHRLYTYLPHTTHMTLHTTHSTHSIRADIGKVIEKRWCDAGITLVYSDGQDAIHKTTRSYTLMKIRAHAYTRTHL